MRHIGGLLTLNELKVDICITDLRPHDDILSVLKHLPVIIHLLLSLSQTLTLLLAACLLTLGSLTARRLAGCRLVRFAQSS